MEKKDPFFVVYERIFDLLAEEAWQNDVVLCGMEELIEETKDEWIQNWKECWMEEAIGSFQSRKEKNQS